MIGTVSKEFEFPAGHRLMTYEGDCKNSHGHNYKLIVGIKGIANENTGMITDFKEIKRVVKEMLDKYFDHFLILNAKDVEYINFAVKMGWKVFTLPQEPTAENMAAFMYHYLQKDLHDIKFVELYETSTSKVRYEGGD